MPYAAAPGRPPGVPLGRVRGIAVYLAPSWGVAGVLLSYAVAPAFSHPRSPGPAHYVAAAFAIALFAASVLAHELAHAAVARRLGLRVERITLALLGGASELDGEPRDATGEYAVAVAGPLMSVFLAGVMAAVAGATGGGTGVGRAVHVAAAFVALTNTVVAGVNLLPGFPLDGGRIVRAAVWHATGRREAGTLAAVRGGQAVALVVGAVGLVRVGAGDELGLVEVALGAFLWVNVRAIAKRSAVLDRLARVDVRSLVRPALPVEATLPLAEALRRAVDSGRRLLVVDGYGAPAGVISGQALEAVPPHRRPWVSVADVSRPIEPGLVLDDRLDGARLVERMRATPASEYLVTGAHGVVGVLSAHDVARALESGREPTRGPEGDP